MDSFFIELPLHPLWEPSTSELSAWSHSNPESMIPADVSVFVKEHAILLKPHIMNFRIRAPSSTKEPAELVTRPSLDLGLT